jgi:hypothetical protein
MQEVLFKFSVNSQVLDMWDILHSEEDVNALDIIRSRLAVAAAPTDEILSRAYYHGTTKAENARKIFVDGIQSQTIENPRRMMAPVPGHVYITPHLEYGLIYALGANMIGSEIKTDMISRWGEYGYLFEIVGSDLLDVYPDEDSVGEFLSEVLRPTTYRKIHADGLTWLRDLGNSCCSPKQLKAVKDGEVAEWARAGKKLVKQMQPWQALELVKRGAHVAHRGNLKFKRCWRLDRSRNAELNEDGSNFFDKAFEVKSVSDIL